MISEIQPTEQNDTLMSDALNLRFKAQQRALYPTAEDIIKELKNEKL